MSSAPTPSPVRFPAVVEQAVEAIVSLLHSSYGVAPRAVALLVLAQDPEITPRVFEREGSRAAEIRRIVEATQAQVGEPLNYLIMKHYHDAAAELLKGAFFLPAERRRSLKARLGEWTMRPWPGLPILALVLYLGFYQFVGVLGAGTVVDFLEGRLFEGLINPWINRWVETRISWPWLKELIGLDYGVITLGLRYAVGIVLPIVGFFFLVFSLVEDSGYLPRLALLLDRVFKAVGLNGRAVIPLVLGFGCDTIATVVSRTLETRREKIIATLLLALGIPCSAQLGVILAILSGRPLALFIWALVVLLVLLLVGFAAYRLLPGRRPGFYMEIPPLRWPKPGAVLTKTLARVRWYFLEVLPLFLGASVVIWAGRLSGLFDWLLFRLSPVMEWMGLPPEIAPAFLYGFFRRDYGAAGLYDLASREALTGNQLLVASVILTLFVPCVAQLTVMFRERGVKTALGIVGFIFPFAFFCGYLLSRLLATAGLVL